MIETIMTMCSLYMGQQAIDCRLHIRHCVEMKNASIEIKNKNERLRCISDLKKKDKVCFTFVFDMRYCNSINDQYSYCYNHEDSDVSEADRNDWLESCAKKEGVI